MPESIVFRRLILIFLKTTDQVPVKIQNIVPSKKIPAVDPLLLDPEMPVAMQRNQDVAAHEMPDPVECVVIAEDISFAPDDISALDGMDLMKSTRVLTILILGDRTGGQIDAYDGIKQDQRQTVTFQYRAGTVLRAQQIHHSDRPDPSVDGTDPEDPGHIEIIRIGMIEIMDDIKLRKGRIHFHGGCNGIMLILQMHGVHLDSVLYKLYDHEQLRKIETKNRWWITSGFSSCSH